jgi:hypothetical protein
MLHVAKSLSRCLANAYYAYLCEGSWEGWLAKWSQAKQRSIIASLDACEPETPNLVTSMVKREVMVGLDFGRPDFIKVPTKARLINYYRFLAAQERHAFRYYAYQKAISSIFDGSKSLGLDEYDDIRVTVASALNQQAKGRWFDDAVAWAGTPYFYERDGASWDATMGPDHFDIQMTSMEHMVHGRQDEQFREFVAKTSRCKASFKHTAGKAEALDFLQQFAFDIDYTTKSGHNDTSSRNSLINAVITIVALRRVGINEARVLVIGDDCLVVLKPDDGIRASASLSDLLEAEKSCGIKPEAAVLPPEAACRVEFASDSFAPCVGPDGERCSVAIPKLGKLFAKLFVTTHQVSGPQRAAYAHSVAVGLRALVGRAPLYGDFLRTTIDDTLPTVVTGKWTRQLDEENTDGIHYDDEFVVWLMTRYGITRQHIAELSHELKNLHGPVFFTSPIVQHIVRIDTSGPMDRCAVAAF